MLGLRGSHESDGAGMLVTLVYISSCSSCLLSLSLAPIADIVSLIPTLSTLIQPYISSDVTLYTILNRSIRSTNHLRSHLLLP
jgi:hypothetical protein